MQPIGTGTTVRAHAKSGGGIRWLTELSPSDERTYARLVGHLVAGTRAPGSADLAPARPSGLRMARAAWQTEIRARAARLRSPVLVRSDVEACYPSIGREALGHGLSRLGARPAEIRALRVFLAAVQSEGTPGLPIGPRPSALLADVVMSVADEAVRGTGASVVRWVDDVVLLANGRRAASRAFDAWAAALGDLGLRPHDGKTSAASGDAAVLDEIVCGASAAHHGARGRIGAP